MMLPTGKARVLQRLSLMMPMTFIFFPPYFPCPPTGLPAGRRVPGNQYLFRWSLIILYKLNSFCAGLFAGCFRTAE
jgi:hypothetical protein